MAIFSTIGIPIFNTVQDVITNEAYSREFDDTVTRIEMGFRIVEYNDTAVYRSTVNLLDGMAFHVDPDSWTIKVEFTGARMHLVKYIYSRTSPISLLFDNVAGECVLAIEKINGFILVRITKEGV